LHHTFCIEAAEVAGDTLPMATVERVTKILLIILVVAALIVGANGYNQLTVSLMGDTFPVALAMFQNQQATDFEFSQKAGKISRCDAGRIWV
jgi:hypothetical protein